MPGNEIIACPPAEFLRNLPGSRLFSIGYNFVLRGLRNRDQRELLLCNDRVEAGFKVHPYEAKAGRAMAEIQQLISGGQIEKPVSDLL
jgi:hypothetical protein